MLPIQIEEFLGLLFFVGSEFFPDCFYFRLNILKSFLRFDGNAVEWVEKQADQNSEKDNRDPKVVAGNNIIKPYEGIIQWLVKNDVKKLKHMLREWGLWDMINGCLTQWMAAQ